MGITRYKIVACVVLILSTSAAAIADTLTWQAESQRASIADGMEYMILTGNALIRSGSMEISAEEIEASGSNWRYVNCRGGVRVFDSERGIRIESENLFYDRELEITRIDGYTEMQDLTNEVVVKGGFFEYLGQDELVVIQIGVRIIKITEDSELTCRAELARYQRDLNTLELTGVPRVTRNDDEYSASRIIINLDTDEIILEDGVRGSIVEAEES